MNAPHVPSKSREPRFKEGDRVAVPLGARMVDGEVIEDRGPIGVNGRRLFRVRLAQDGDESDREFEVPEEDLQRAD